MWFLQHKIILTKDNLAKQNWNRCKNIAFVIKMKQYSIYS